MGLVFWITGLSGAGKTTIGKLFYKKLKEVHPNTVFLDGDSLRQVFGNDLGYTYEERIKCAMRYSKLCQMLQMQDLNVVCCTISMFDDIREWNRRNIRNYQEIYIKVDMDTLKKRDQKGLYSGITEEIHKEVAGIHLKAEEPKRPDMILENDGYRSPEEQAEKLFHFFKDCIAV